MLCSFEERAPPRQQTAPLAAIAALVVVAALGATGVGVRVGAQAELAALQAYYDELETRAGIA